MKQMSAIIQKLKIGLVAALIFVGGCREEESVAGHTYVTEMEGLPITLAFDTHEERYYGKAVNRYFGTYRMAGNRIFLRYPSSTMWGGDSDDMATEEIYFTALTRVESFKLDHGELVLMQTGGGRIIFRQTN